MSFNLEGASNGTSAYSLAGLTGLSGAATTFSTAALTLQFSIKGKAYAKAQVSGGTTPVVDYADALAFTAQGASTACTYVWGFDSAGTIRLVQGSIVAWTDTTASSTAVPFPIIPDGMCPFAYSVIKNSSTGTAWTIGTSNWNQSQITVDTPVNVSRLPSAQPETA